MTINYVNFVNEVNGSVGPPLCSLFCCHFIQSIPLFNEKLCKCVLVVENCTHFFFLFNLRSILMFGNIFMDKKITIRSLTDCYGWGDRHVQSTASTLCITEMVENCTRYVFIIYSIKAKMQQITCNARTRPLVYFHSHCAHQLNTFSQQVFLQNILLAHTKHHGGYSIQTLQQSAMRSESIFHQFLLY